MNRVSLAVLLALTVPAAASGATLSVPHPYATIQDAVNASHPGDTVLIAGGTYYEQVTIVNKTNLKLRPASNKHVILDAGGSGAALSIGAMGATTSNITVKKLRLRNSGNGSGVWVTYADDVTIQQCVITNMYNGVFASYCGLVFVASCKIDSIGNVGIASFRAEVVAAWNRISSTASNGIVLMGDGNAADYNRIDNTAADAIQIGDATTPTSGCQVHGNVIRHAVGDGIVCVGQVTGAVIKSNSIKDCLDGIDFGPDSSQLIVSKNTVRQCADSGLEVSSDSHTVRKNKIKKAAVDGLWLGFGSQNSYYDRNKVTKSLIDGLEVNGTGNTFVHNTVVGSAVLDLRDNTAPGANTYLGNTFGTAGP